MRKFRYGDPTKGSVVRKWSTLAYVFLGWNALGLLIYQYWRRRNADPQWDQLSGAQKYLHMLGTPERQIKVVRVEGFTTVENKETTIGEFADHCRKPTSGDGPKSEKIDNCVKSE